jgi:hypothetical protein
MVMLNYTTVSVKKVNKSCAWTEEKKRMDQTTRQERGKGECPAKRWEKKKSANYSKEATRWAVIIDSNHQSPTLTSTNFRVCWNGNRKGSDES